MLKQKLSSEKRTPYLDKMSEKAIKSAKPNSPKGVTTWQNITKSRKFWARKRKNEVSGIFYNQREIFLEIITQWTEKKEKRVCALWKITNLSVEGSTPVITPPFSPTWSLTLFFDFWVCNKRKRRFNQEGGRCDGEFSPKTTLSELSCELQKYGKKLQQHFPYEASLSLKTSASVKSPSNINGKISKRKQV